MATSLVWFATFAGPFGPTGNGYFAAWFTLACASRALLFEAGRPEADAAAADVQAAVAGNLLALVGVASSVVVIGAAAGRQGWGLYALFAGGVSLACVLVVLLHRVLHADQAADLEATVFCSGCGAAAWRGDMLLATFLALWWAAAVIALTFFGPYGVTSNSYFACWVAFGCSVWLA
eukprot:1612948-Prymnesium_polylepis.1